MPSRQCPKTARQAALSMTDWLFSTHLGDGSRIKITQPPIGSNEGSRSVKPERCEEERTKWGLKDDSAPNIRTEKAPNLRSARGRDLFNAHRDSG
jgi:hypothetical protein